MACAGISALGYSLPATIKTVSEVVASGQTDSDEEKLVQLGFGSIRVAESESAVELAIAAVHDLTRRSGFDLDQIDVVLYAGALANSSVLTTDAAEAWGTMVDPAPLFRFPATCLQSALGIPNAAVLGVSQLACSSLQGAIRLARALVLSDPSVRHVLCVAADRFPARAKREIVYNLMSDGASAVVVSRYGGCHRLLATTQITRGAYWDGAINHDQLIAAYFPLARRVIFEALEIAGIRPEELDLLVPHNLNLKSWQILARVIGIPIERIYTRNISRVGHVVASDNVINYLDAIEEGRVASGDRVAHFVMGFGAHWSCTVLEA